MTEDTYDYEGKGFLNPISVDEVRESIKEALSEFGGVSVETESAKEGIEKLTKQKMFEFWEKLNYLNEDSGLEELAYRLFDEQNPDLPNHPFDENS